MPVNSATLRRYRRSVFVECLPASARIRGPVTPVRALRHAYAGDLIEITTTGDHVLSTTPNHPILTLSGWVSAGSLNEGSYVVCGSHVQGMRLGNPDVDHPSTPIGEIVDSFQRVHQREGISFTHVDLDIDTSDGKVEVVSANGQLLLDTNPSFSQPVRHQAFSSANLRSAALSRHGSGIKGTFVQGSASNRFMRSNLHPEKRPGVTKHANALRVMARNNEPAALGQLLNPGSGNPEHSSDAISAFASGVTTERIIRIRRKQFDGHVYNLETSTGWYEAEGIIVHNTGTFLGDGTMAALEAGFDKVYTVEVHSGLYAAACQRFQGDERVELFEGSSPQRFQEILPRITGPATFWLDAHTCGGGTGGAWEEVLIPELRLIATHPLKNHIILMDDIHLFGRELPGMTEVLNRLADINPTYTISIIASADPNLGPDILAAVP